MVLVVAVGDGDGPATHGAEDSAEPVDSSQTAEKPPSGNSNSSKIFRKWILSWELSESINIEVLSNQVSNR